MYVVDQRELDVLDGILKIPTTRSKYGARTPGTLTTAVTNVYSKNLIKQSKKEICMW